jgi:hypothetical protein
MLLTFTTVMGTKIAIRPENVAMVEEIAPDWSNCIIHLQTNSFSVIGSFEDTLNKISPRSESLSPI